MIANSAKPAAAATANGLRKADQPGQRIDFLAKPFPSAAQAPTNYQASHIKRHRATKAEIEGRRSALFDIVANMRPMTVRQVFYQATVVARGYASLSFLHRAADYIGQLEVPTYVYHFGDYDPSGVNAAEKIEQTLREMARDAEIHFERVAVQPWQVEEWSLPTRPTKTSDTRSKNFGDISVELDAIDRDRLRGLVSDVIERHLPEHEFNILKTAEESERTIIRQLVDHAIDGRAA
jgi:hypothetical protein